MPKFKGQSSRDLRGEGKRRTWGRGPVWTRSDTARGVTRWSLRPDRLCLVSECFRSDKLSTEITGQCGKSLTGWLKSLIQPGSGGSRL